MCQRNGKRLRVEQEALERGPTGHNHSRIRNGIIIVRKRSSSWPKWSGKATSVVLCRVSTGAFLSCRDATVPMSVVLLCSAHTHRLLPRLEGFVSPSHPVIVERGPLFSCPLSLPAPTPLGPRQVTIQTPRPSTHCPVLSASAGPWWLRSRRPVRTPEQQARHDHGQIRQTERDDSERVACADDAAS